MRRFLDGLYLAGGYASGISLVTIFLLMMFLAIGREINFNIPSGDDFASWALVSMAFLGLAHTFKRGEMIRVGLLLERLSPSARRLAEISSLSVGIAFIGYFTYQAGILSLDSWRYKDMSTGVVSVPLWIPQLGMVVGLGLLLIAMIDELIIVLGGGRPTYVPEPPKSVDELVERVAQGGGV